MLRREFLKFLGLATIAVTATGLSGTEVIETIAQAEKIPLSYDEIVALELERVRLYLPTLFERDCPFFAAIEKDPVVVSTRSMRIPLQLKPN